VLLPPEEVSKEAIRLSELVAHNFPVEFVLDGKTLYPHLTLYQLEVPDKNLSIVKKRLSNIFKLVIKAKFDHYFGSESGFLSWDCSTDKNLFGLHKEIVKSLNPLREGLSLPLEKLKYNFLTDQHYLQIEKFGSSGLFEYFRPHITITRLKRGDIYKKALHILPHKKPLVVNFKKAALGKLLIHGSVTQIIEEYNLF
ncbi:hypothetical protein HY008_03010, partial [Candidatus Woesebacteria bacterium]|nr:hypothetical protein [Candidatus Woesebacteria bacterium]